MFKRYLLFISVLLMFFVCSSCGQGISEAESLRLSESPTQVAENMFIVQSTNGRLKMRTEAKLMERYENEYSVYEKFPQGISIYAYAEDGTLETMVFANNALHDVGKSNNRQSWSAFGNVVIQNIKKHETIQTDTLYWDQSEKQIYTDCLVKMFSQDGFMQGYGLRSDEMARNSIINEPFDSYGVIVKDSTRVVIDTINFIGPLLR